MLENLDWSGTLQTSTRLAAEVPTSVPVAERDHQYPRMQLWAMDVWVRHVDILTDRDALRTIMYDEAEAGGATVLGEEFCQFDNAAVTGVLVLAQSHLSIHTWPEHSLANIDLFSCGDMPGEDVLQAIGRRLDAHRTKVACVPRSLP